MSKGEFTFSKFIELKRNLDCRDLEEFVVYMTEDDMRERGYSDTQISEMITGGMLQLPHDMDKFDRWLISHVS